MKDGFIKVAACSPKVVLADPKANADAIIAALHRAAAHGVRLAAFPELAMTGYTCGDLFMHELLLDSVEPSFSASHAKPRTFGLPPS